MTDHLAAAEKLLEETENLDCTLPFVRHTVTRAGVHAILGIAQAFLASEPEPLAWPGDNTITLTPKDSLL